MSPYSPHPPSGDDYASYNKPAALNAWLREDPPPEEVVLLLDPDCVFLEPITDSVARGHPLAEPYSYMDPTTEAHMELVEKHCRNQELVDSVGISILIHRDDPAAVAPL